MMLDFQSICVAFSHQLLAISYSSHRRLEVRKDIAAPPCSLGLSKCQLPRCEDTREAIKGILSSRRPLWATEAAPTGDLWHSSQNTHLSINPRRAQGAGVYAGILIGHRGWTVSRVGGGKDTSSPRQPVWWSRFWQLQE